MCNSLWKNKKKLAASSASANPHPARLRHVAESAALHHRSVIYAHTFQVSFRRKSLPGRRCRNGFLNSYVTCFQQMKTRKNVSKWPNFFDKSQQDEQTDLWLRARVFWHRVAPPPPTTAEVAAKSHGGSAQQSVRRERQRDSWRWRRIRWARTSRLEPESSRNGSRSPWVEPRRRWARGDPLFKKVSLSPRNFLTVPESHCHGSVKLWGGHTWACFIKLLGVEGWKSQHERGRETLPSCPHDDRLSESVFRF